MTRDFIRTKRIQKSGIILGIGMGGFLDGILFHQIFQFHNMLSNQYFPDTLVNVEINMVWDGIFHLATWLTTTVGIAALFHAMRLSGDSRENDRPILIGGLFLGWGLFNFVEGLIDHHLLKLHHVVQRALPDEQLYWDLVFDASGLILIAIGSFLTRRALQVANRPI